MSLPPRTPSIAFTSTSQGQFYGPTGVSSSTMNFVLNNFTQSIQCDVSGVIDTATSIPLDDAHAQAVFYVKTSDMMDVFKFHTDSQDQTNLSSDDIRYFVFMDKWPANLILNPAHAMMDDPLYSSGSLIPTAAPGSILVQSGVVANKNLVKHDYLRYLSLELFGSPYGVDLFANEAEILESIASSGHIAWLKILTLLDSISANPLGTPLHEMSNTALPLNESGNPIVTDPSGNRCFRHDQRKNLNNITAQLLQQIESVYPQRFYDILTSQYSDGSGESSPDSANNYVSIPFRDGDVINFQLKIAAPPDNR